MSRSSFMETNFKDFTAQISVPQSVSRLLRPLVHMSLFILSVCFRGKCNPVPMAQSSRNSDQSSPTGLQDHPNLQELQLGSAYQFPLRLHAARRPTSMFSCLVSTSSLFFRDRFSCHLELTHYIAKGALKLLVPLSSPSECRSPRHAPPCPVYTVLRIKPRTSSMLGKHSMNSYIPACFLSFTRLCACILCSLFQLSRRLSLFIA